MIRINKFSILAIALLLLFISMEVYFFNFYPDDYDFSTLKLFPSVDSLVIFFLAIILGLVMNILSNVYNEPWMMRWYFYLLLIFASLLALAIIMYWKVVTAVY